MIPKLRHCLCNMPLAGLLALLSGYSVAQSPQTVFQENNGMVAVEAEHFSKQSEGGVRAFYVISPTSQVEVEPDGDPVHLEGASHGAYVEVLPDTRRTHDDTLIRDVNFSATPGALAVLHYQIHFTTPGRYYVWVRAYSTGSEDNGIHVGIDGTWPESGQRMQWCQGKNSWRWESRQRTETEHCGEPYMIYLDVDQPGDHTIHFSMREDGFEFDKWLMTTDRNFERPLDVGPEFAVHAGPAPPVHPYIPAAPQAAEHGSPVIDPNSLVMRAAEFPLEESGYYLDKDRWLAIDPNKGQHAETGAAFPFPSGVYDVTLQAIGESDGKSTYELSIDGQMLEPFLCPLSSQMFEAGSEYARVWRALPITTGAIIAVASHIGSEDGREFSRARWESITFTPADESTLAAVESARELQQQSKLAPELAEGSPTHPLSDRPLQEPREANGDGSVTLTGELRQWHKVTLTLDGPFAHEQDNEPNPFTDYRMIVTFRGPDNSAYFVPGYFAADGDAANSSAEAGTSWRAHFAPPVTGKWNYTILFQRGELAALEPTAVASAVSAYNGLRGAFTVGASDKQGRDLRAHGQLRYVGQRYLQFAGSQRFFLKAGADAPETLLAYSDFDNTLSGNPKRAPLKSWSPHIQDWNPGDPTWKNDLGKGLIGAINYLSGKGCNAFSFLTYNAGGDGDNVWPFIDRDDKLHYDCSKLDQWGIVFDHGCERGMYLHFKLQETENDDHRRGAGSAGAGSVGVVNSVPESLDGGNLGIQRKLYCRELIARFGHNLALNWNLGEENTQSTEQQIAMLDYIAQLDPYQHNRVVHTFPNQQDKVYLPLLGDQSRLTGVSLQNGSIADTHSQTVKWVEQSARAGKPWVVAFDESGSAAHAQCPDLGYRGYDGHDLTGKMTYTQHEVRKQTLWGQLMGGGAGVEYYFGYQYAENDLICEDWRSRDRSWDYCRIAIDFFYDQQIPFWNMRNADELVGNKAHDNSRYCLAAPGELYLVYLPQGGSCELDLSGAQGEFTLQWFNPREGGELQSGSLDSLPGGRTASLGMPPHDVEEDWLILVKRMEND